MHTCAINNNNELYCWGYNPKGEVGVGDKDNRNTPERVGTASDWKTVYLGTHLTCALKQDNYLYCWGDNSGGQLGIGNTTLKNTPTRVGNDIWDEIRVGSNHVCGIRNSKLFCWGGEILMGN